MPGFRPHPAQDCIDNPDFVDSQGYLCKGWEGFDCWTEEHGYTEKDRWPVRQNCRKSCGTCEGKGTFGMPWPTVIDAIEGSMYVSRGGEAGTALNTGMFIQVCAVYPSVPCVYACTCALCLCLYLCCGGYACAVAMFVLYICAVYLTALNTGK